MSVRLVLLMVSAVVLSCAGCGGGGAKTTIPTEFAPLPTKSQEGGLTPKPAKTMK